MEKKDRILKILFPSAAVLFAAAFILFILVLMREPVPKDADFSAIREALLREGLTGNMREASERDMKISYGMLPSDFPEALHFTPMTYMDVDELLLVRTSGDEQTEEIMEACEAYRDRQMNVFENYGTDQYTLLSSALLYSNGSYAVYSVGPHAEEALALIRSMTER